MKIWKELEIKELDVMNTNHGNNHEVFGCNPPSYSNFNDKDKDKDKDKEHKGRKGRRGRGWR